MTYTIKTTPSYNGLEALCGTILMIIIIQIWCWCLVYVFKCTSVIGWAKKKKKRDDGCGPRQHHLIPSIHLGLYGRTLAGTVQNGTGKTKFHIPFIFSSLSFNLFLFLFGDGGWWWWPLNKRWETEMCCVCVSCYPAVARRFNRVEKRERERKKMKMDGQRMMAGTTGVCRRRWCARHARKTRGFVLFQKLSGKKPENLSSSNNLTGSEKNNQTQLM